ncbi:GAP family protein [Mycobacterium sp. DL592]|uniref:GAP family protein n=1 Tax=Mycobacterium sp. DL592 TaxID=2675524 RepID=UPI001420D1B9|nr:GAP family protein [Mycobacterium sp. DL592]
MWFTLLVMAAAVSVEPFRVGMTVLMLNRPRPVLQLTAFLFGGFLMGLTVGAVVVFALGAHITARSDVTLPMVQIAIGALALLASLALAVTRGRERPPPDWLRRALTRPSLVWAGVAGLGIALPSVDYLAALAVIAAADVTSTTRVAALVMFNVVAFALVELPLLAYLVAPQRTYAATTAVHRWIRARSRREVAALLAVIGAVLLIAGLAPGLASV